MSSPVSASGLSRALCATRQRMPFRGFSVGRVRSQRGILDRIGCARRQRSPFAGRRCSTCSSGCLGRGGRQPCFRPTVELGIATPRSANGYTGPCVGLRRYASRRHDPDMKPARAVRAVCLERAAPRLMDATLFAPAYVSASEAQAYAAARPRPITQRRPCISPARLGLSRGRVLLRASS